MSWLVSNMKLKLYSMKTMLEVIEAGETYAVLNGTNQQVLLTREELEALYHEMRDVLIYGEER